MAATPAGIDSWRQPVVLVKTSTANAGTLSDAGAGAGGLPALDRASTRPKNTAAKLRTPRVCMPLLPPLRPRECTSAQRICEDVTRICAAAPARNGIQRPGRQTVGCAGVVVVCRNWLVVVGEFHGANT